MAELYRISLPHATFGLVAHGGLVVRAAPTSPIGASAGAWSAPVQVTVAMSGGTVRPYNMVCTGSVYEQQWTSPPYSYANGISTQAVVICPEEAEVAQTLFVQQWLSGPFGFFWYNIHGVASCYGLLWPHQIFCPAGNDATWGGVPQYGEFRVMDYATIYAMDGSTGYADVPGDLFFT